MSEINCYTDKTTGRITLTRPEVLNALSYEMCLEMEAALTAWRDDAKITQVIIDAEGERAFCAGGDIAKLYETGRQGDFAYGHRFWTDEYRLNALIAHYPKPYIAFMHGFVMGGGVGISCHGSHRIAGNSAKFAMPECAIGLIPDVGGTALLARAPGQTGLFLGLTGYRMNAADSLYAGFADICIDEIDFAAAKDALIRSGAPDILADFACEPEKPACLPGWQRAVDRHFAAADIAALTAATGTAEIDTAITRALDHSSPLAMLCTAEIIRRLADDMSVERALALEYRYAHRSMAHGDFLEGIRAAIIDKDKNPVWRHKTMQEIDPMTVDFMLSAVDGQ